MLQETHWVLIRNSKGGTGQMLGLEEPLLIMSIFLTSKALSCTPRSPSTVQDTGRRFPMTFWLPDEMRNLNSKLRKIFCLKGVKQIIKQDG